MHRSVEVDQSGKADQTDRATILAMASGIQFSIRLNAREKRACLKEFKRRRSARSRTMHRILLFATLLFLLLKEHIGRLDQVIIDVEYQGYEGSIKEHLINLFRRHRIAVTPDTITFGHVGKQSPAHDLAVQVFKKERPPDREITAKEVLAEF